MTDISRFKKLLSTSTTMPYGTGQAGNSGQVLFGNHTHSHDHAHKADGSCCGHDHDHSHAHDDEDEDCCDNTNPKGGCC